MEEKMNIDFEAEHYCPVYDKEIDSDICYERLMCFSKMFKVESVPEFSEISDIDKARIMCKECPYSNL